MTGDVTMTKSGRSGSTRLTPPPIRRKCLPGRRGFSLVELMIAIVILGFGMIMAASMFPVGWTRARKLSEHTVRNSVKDNVGTVLENMLLPAGPDFSTAAFAGDLIFEREMINQARALVRPEYAIRQISDTRVHALHLENIRFANRALVPEDPWVLEWMGDGWVDDINIIPHPDAATYRTRSYFSPRVRFNERLCPPMKPRESWDFNDTDDEWDDTLDLRKYCWAVFHKMDTPVGPEIIGTTVPQMEAALAQAETANRAARSINLYYVTLRRPRASLRYAVQNPAASPDPSARATAVKPGALGPAFDVSFPVPWRAQIKFDKGTIASEDDPANPPTFVPTEAVVNGQGSGYVVDLFPEGAVLIDEVSGQLYTVVSRRVSNATPSIVTLTLDREIFISDLDDGQLAPPSPGDLEDYEVLRAVWLFPPPVLPRVVGAAPVFRGDSPVVGIETENKSFGPDLE